MREKPGGRLQWLRPSLKDPYLASSSLVVGSDERKLSIESRIAIRWQMLTQDLDGLPALCFNPFPASEPFEPDQFWVFQAKLCSTSEVLLGNSRQYEVTNRCGVAAGRS